MPTLTGTAGNDVIAGGGLDDILDGLAGDDILAGGGGADLISGGSGRNALDGGEGLDTASYLDATRGVTVSLATTLYQDTGFSVDELRNFEGLIGSRDYADTLTGGAGDDVLDPGSRLSLFVGQPPSARVDMNDRVFGGAGNDVITVQGNSNGDQLFGEDGDDTITVGFSGTYAVYTNPYRTVHYFAYAGTAVQISGGAGNDVLSASTHSVIDGGAGDDVITASMRVGTPGNISVFDVFRLDYVGGTRGVRLTGGEGRDTFVVSGAEGVAVITDFEVASDRFNIVGTLAQDGANTLILGSAALGAVGQVIARLSNVDASAIPATSFLAGNSPVIFTYLTDASETAQGNALIGNGGNDVLSAVGTTGAQLFGSAGNDTLIGGTGSDRLYGDIGDDILYGGLGADVMSSGPNSDIFRYLLVQESNAAAYDIITDFQGVAPGRTSGDRLDLSALTVTSLTLQYTRDYSLFVYVATTTGTLQIGISYGQFGPASIITSATVGATIFGSAYSDIWLWGSNGADLILGGEGEDQIWGLAGADALGGGLHADTFHYVSAADSNASGFDNLFDFETGVDRIELRDLYATSFSIVRTDDGSSFLFAETASGVFMTSAAGRVINGSDIIINTIYDALPFGVYMVGSSLGESLIGSAQKDSIHGGGGNDTIIGGRGGDVLFGGAGADRFVVQATADSTVAAADTIFDFVSGQDVLDLSAVRTGASDAFGIAYFNSGSFVFVDLGGNGSNDLLIQLANTTLVASDIRWTASASELEPTIKEVGPEVLTVSDAAGFGSSWLDTINDGGMLFLADAAPASARGHDWYL